MGPLWTTTSFFLRIYYHLFGKFARNVCVVHEKQSKKQSLCQVKTNMLNNFSL